MDTIAERKVHMQCSLNAIDACSNSVCKKSIVSDMHETAKRLLDMGLARGAKDFTEIARSLGGSDQSATNWKTRGVPKAILRQRKNTGSTWVGYRLMFTRSNLRLSHAGERVTDGLRQSNPLRRKR